MVKTQADLKILVNLPNGWRTKTSTVPLKSIDLKNTLPLTKTGWKYVNYIILDCDTEIWHQEEKLQRNMSHLLCKKNEVKKAERLDSFRYENMGFRGGTHTSRFNMEI